MKRELRAPSPHFSQPGETYSRENETQFRLAVAQAIQDAIEFVARTSVATPSTLGAGNNNNYDPGPRATTIRLTPDATGSTLTGIQQGAPGRRIRIVSLGADLTIAHESASSSAVNRVTIPGGVGVVLGQNDLIDLEADPITERWRMIFSTGIIQQYAAEVPTLFASAIQTPDDSAGTDLTCGVYWTYQAAALPDYTMTVDLYVGGVLVETDTGVDPAASQPYTITDVGGGGLTGPQTAYARVRMIRVSDSAVIGDVTSSTVGFDGYY